MNAKGWKCCVSLELNLDLVGCVEIDSIAVPLFTNIRGEDQKNCADAETRGLVYIETLSMLVTIAFLNKS